jgi:hypothetical protein
LGTGDETSAGPWSRTGRRLAAVGAYLRSAPGADLYRGKVCAELTGARLRVHTVLEAMNTGVVAA